MLYTPSVLTTPRALKDELDQALSRTNICIEQHLIPAGQTPRDTWGQRQTKNHVQLIIVDESERLRPTALELLRDRYDRDNIALILIGMPGLEKQFSHYPSSTAGSGSPTSTAPSAMTSCSSSCNAHWRSIGKTLEPDDFTDAQTIAAITRVTRGNFRLLEQLFP